MALKSFLSLTDDKLADKYAYTAPDPSKARKTFIRALDKALIQFNEGKQPRGDKALWSAKNNIVRFAPKVTIDGKDEFHIPSERFENAITELKASVEAGELDKALLEGTSDTPQAEKPKRTRAGWSPERRAKQEAAIAKRQAAKN